MIEEPSKIGEHKAVKFVKTYYKSCMDTQKIEVNNTIKTKHIFNFMMGKIVFL